MKRRPTPEELLARVAEHDPESLAEFYDRFSPALYGMLIRMLGDRVAAEEVLEESFARISGEAKRISRAGRSAQAALVFIARERALDRRRMKGHDHTRQASGFDRQLLLLLPRPEEVALLEERRELLTKVVGQLPSPQRGALEMLVLEGQPETAIARALNEPPARVRAGLVASLAFLRHRMAAVLRIWTAAI